MANQARARIALIDDDTTFLQLMQELLESQEGYEVLICTDGAQAYEFVKEQKPDLVIVDIRMGGEETGWTILEQLNLDPWTRPIPFIVCSAAVRELEDHQALLDKYEVDALPKPFDLDRLLEKAEANLAKSAR